MSDWTVATLKQYVDQRLADNDRAVSAALSSRQGALLAALQATKEALAKADESGNKRFEAQERAVATAFDASKEAIAKSELAVEKRSDAVYVTITKLQDALAAVMPRAEAEQRFTSLSEKLTENTNRANLSEGVTKGSDITIGKIYAAIGAVGAILGILVLLANGVF